MDPEFSPHPPSLDDPASLKLPPHSIRSEQSLLGGLMLDNTGWEAIAGKLGEADLYRKDHQLIFRAITALESNGDPFDVVTVSEWLESRQLLDDTGGLSYVAALAENVPTSAHSETYAKIVRSRSILRQLVRIGNQITTKVYNPEGLTDQEILEYAEQSIFEIAEQQSRGKQGARPIKELLVETLDRIDKLYHSDSPITGVATGYTELDILTSGLQSGDLVIVAGRPSMGKTAFAINIAEHVAIGEKMPVAIFSMEMPAEQLTMRMMSSLGRIDQSKIRSGQLTDDDWPRITSAVGMLSGIDMYIDDTPALSPTELRARCRRLARDKGLGLVVVDYLQLMAVPGTNENRATEISEISRSLKAMAKELRVPVIALSQLNRAVESRNDKRPVMSDLRESGAIEQDADVIAFIYRDEFYDEDSKDKGVAEIIIGKQRNGPIGTVRLAFLGQFTRFENLAPESYAQTLQNISPGAPPTAGQ